MQEQAHPRWFLLKPMDQLAALSQPKMVVSSLSRLVDFPLECQQSRWVSSVSNEPRIVVEKQAEAQNSFADTANYLIQLKFMVHLQSLNFLALFVQSRTIDEHRHSGHDRVEALCVSQLFKRLSVKEQSEKILLDPRGVFQHAKIQIEKSDRLATFGEGCLQEVLF